MTSPLENRAEFERAARAIGMFGGADPITNVNPTDPRWRQTVIGAIERLTGQRRLHRIYGELGGRDRPIDEFLASVVAHLRLDLRFDPARLEALPREGPLVIVANHPFGVVDGLALMHLVPRVRPEAMGLANHLLYRIPELRPRFIPLDIYAGPESRVINRFGRAAASEHLKRGGALVVFPSGGVATASRILDEVHDLPWKNFVGKLIRRHRAASLPIFIAGRNSRAFHAVSALSGTGRQAALIHETFRMIGREIRLEIGSAIPPEQARGFAGAGELVRHLRQATYALDKRSSPNDAIAAFERRLVARAAKGPTPARPRAGAGRPSGEPAPQRG